MHTTDQLSFQDFVPRFFKTAFHAYYTLQLRRRREGRRRFEGSPDEAVVWLLDHQDDAGLFFDVPWHEWVLRFLGPMVVDGDGNERESFYLPKAILASIDFGPRSKDRKPLFATFEAALSNMLSAPLRPSIAWCAKDRIEAAFLMAEPYLIDNCRMKIMGSPFAEMICVEDRIHAVAESLRGMLGEDNSKEYVSTFQVPRSLNYDPADGARSPLLWCDFDRHYRFDELERVARTYGIDDILSTADKKEPEWRPGPADSIDALFDDLPQDLRDMIKGGGPPGKRLYRVVSRMVREGYSDSCIRDAVWQGGGFRWLSKDRETDIASLVNDAIEYMRQGKRVYAPKQAPPIEISNIAEPVPLAECGPLAVEFEDLLALYEAAAGIALAPRVRDAAKFFNSIFEEEDFGVLESPCGSGKSVWALCRTALQASPENRHIYVVETVDALYAAAGMLEKLTATPVGRVHSFNAAKCREVCGEDRTWRQCMPSDPQSKCRSCPASGGCAFHTGAEQRRRPILCIAHNGFIRMLEEDDGTLKDATVIVDEDLSQFSGLRVSFDDLDRLRRIVGLDLSPFFPCTSFAGAGELRKWNVEGEKSFAERNYVFVDDKATAALGSLCAELRAAFHANRRQSSHGADAEGVSRAADTLSQLLNFFRSGANADATYAYREGREGTERYVVAKRSRFSFGTERPYRKLWLLNASAQLSPHPYPDNLPVFACPDLPGNSRLVTLHIVRCNPTKTRQAEAVRLSSVPLRLGACGRHDKVLLALDKESDSEADVRTLLRAAWNDQHLAEDADKGPAVVERRRGRIKGVNNAGDCTLALLTAMASFTGIDDCAMHAALHYRRTFPSEPHVFTAGGSPNWPGGRMRVPAMRTYYALKSLDELYQAIWRTAVRNDRAVEAVVALPDEHWLAALYRTTMPDLCVGSAWNEINIRAKKADGDGDAEGKNGGDGKNGGTLYYEQDTKMYGLGGLLALPPGEEVQKAEVADRLGYEGSRAWEKNKGTIMALLDGFFEEGSTNRVLRRRGDA